MKRNENFENVIFFLTKKIRAAGRQRLWKDDDSVVHCSTAQAEYRHDSHLWTGDRHARIWNSWEESGLYAAGEQCDHRPLQP